MKDISGGIKMVESELHVFLRDTIPHLTALGVFMLISVSISVESSTMNKALVILTSGISFFILLDLLIGLNNTKGLLSSMFEAFLYILVIFFPVWVILSVIVKNFSNLDIIPLILFLIFIVLVPILKIYNAPKKQKPTKIPAQPTLSFKDFTSKKFKRLVYL